MAFLTVRRILSPNSQINNNFRLISTLTSPKLFISGLSRQTTDAKLKEEFSRFGQLVEAKVITDRESGRSKGFGFITYEKIEEAELAKEKMNATYLDGWVIFLDPAKQREARPPPQYQSQSQPQPQPQSSENGYTVNKTVGWCG